MLIHLTNNAIFRAGDLFSTNTKVVRGTIIFPVCSFRGALLLRNMHLTYFVPGNSETETFVLEKMR